jgi:hypothetical protein
MDARERLEEAVLGSGGGRDDDAGKTRVVSAS